MRQICVPVCLSLSLSVSETLSLRGVAVSLSLDGCGVARLSSLCEIACLAAAIFAEEDRDRTEIRLGRLAGGSAMPVLLPSSCRDRETVRLVQLARRLRYRSCLLRLVRSAQPSYHPRCCSAIHRSFEIAETAGEDLT